MIDWYGMIFERSKSFYLVSLVLFVCAIGLSSFALYKHFDKAPALRESILLYNALSTENLHDLKGKLQSIVAAKHQPYASIAAIHLAKLPPEYLDDSKRKELYNFVYLNSPYVYIREFSKLNLELLNRHVENHLIYTSTSQFLDAVIQFLDGKVDNAEMSLGNIGASVDVNLYLRSLSNRLLDALSYERSVSDS
ncbi:hypothetical protein [Neorickettsia findlayensis]|uniref:Uncharacterized protein n=1 Tax=Neorickettsia findlayensis TaxID=2686014 RepID=A0A6P1GAM9_9RICK|nr:hypothetical protein [Neorickettsia findlayensis]QHD65273.1 hypothetical protein GP480_02300 [Neorickettsia findlayensis]